MTDNDARAEEYKRKLEEHDAEAEAAGKLFNLKELFERARKLKTVVDPVLGKIQYGELTFEDSFAFKCITDPDERTLTIAYLMLKKAYPDVTLDMVRKMPLIEAGAFMNIVQGFLSPITAQQSTNGSKTTRRHKKLE